LHWLLSISDLLQHSRLDTLTALRNMDQRPGHQNYVLLPMVQFLAKPVQYQKSGLRRIDINSRERELALLRPRTYTIVRKSYHLSSPSVYSTAAMHTHNLLSAGRRCHTQGALIFHHMRISGQLYSGHRFSMIENWRCSNILGRWQEAVSLESVMHNWCWYTQGAPP
jgi:hypothetical protein